MGKERVMGVKEGVLYISDLHRKMCDPDLLTFSKESGSHLLEGLSYVKFSLNNCKF